MEGLKSIIKGRDFIFTGLQPWDIPIGSNAKDIAKEISKNNRVLYISTPLDIRTYKTGNDTPDNIRRKDVILKKKPALRQLSSTFWILDLPFPILPINFLPDGVIFDFFNYYNNKKIYSFVKNTIRELNFSNYILFIDNDAYRSMYAIKMLKPIFSVYYRRDNLVSKFWQRHIKRIEPKICAECNIVLANSIYLADMVRPYNKKSYDVGQGLDLSDYSTEIKYIIPDDIKSIPKPIVGYAGWITSLRLDANLLYSIASKLNTVSFVMVGSEDEYFVNHKLHTLKNVYFLGQKQAKQIPSYISSFDICINPQLINDITLGNYPRKIDEYLSLGKKVIATKTRAMEMFEPYVWNCIGVQEYVNAVNDALANNSKEDELNRILFAKTHTWEKSVEKIYSHILDNITL
ncbi:MAG: glycosyltransferase [Bacteroidales bacterium]